jgi:hypothetical protein
VLGVVRALIDATDALAKDQEKFIQVAVNSTGSPPDVVKEAVPHGKLDYKLYATEAKALMGMLHEAKLTQIDATPAVDQHFDYSLLEQATGQPKNQLGGE